MPVNVIPLGGGGLAPAAMGGGYAQRGPSPMEMLMGLTAANRVRGRDADSEELQLLGLLLALQQQREESRRNRTMEDTQLRLLAQQEKSGETERSLMDLNRKMGQRELVAQSTMAVRNAMVSHTGQLRSQVARNTDMLRSDQAAGMQAIGDAYSDFRQSIKLARNSSIPEDARELYAHRAMDSLGRMKDMLSPDQRTNDAWYVGVLSGAHQISFDATREIGQVSAGRTFPKQDDILRDLRSLTRRLDLIREPAGNITSKFARALDSAANTKMDKIARTEEDMAARIQRRVQDAIRANGEVDSVAMYNEFGELVNKEVGGPGLDLGLDFSPITQKLQGMVRATREERSPAASSRTLSAGEMMSQAGENLGDIGSAVGDIAGAGGAGAANLGARAMMALTGGAPPGTKVQSLGEAIEESMSPRLRETLSGIYSHPYIFPTPENTTLMYPGDESDSPGMRAYTEALRGRPTSIIDKLSGIDLHPPLFTPELVGIAQQLSSAVRQGSGAGAANLGARALMALTGGAPPGDEVDLPRPSGVTVRVKVPTSQPTTQPSMSDAMLEMMMDQKRFSGAGF